MQKIRTLHKHQGCAIRDTDMYGYHITVDPHVQVDWDGSHDCYRKKLGRLGFRGDCKSMTMDTAGCTDRDIALLLSRVEKYPVWYRCDRYLLPWAS